MQNKVSFVFPGQGSQSVGMLSDISQHFDLVIDTFAQASHVLEYDLWQIVCQGPVERLNQTIYTQPAMLAADIALLRVWQQKGSFSPALMAGHSLGEYAALVAAEAIDFSDAIKIVTRRAQLMQEAVKEGEGAMAVILALAGEQVIELCKGVSNSVSGLVQAVNFNAPGQTVIAGHTRAVDQILEKAKSLGAKQAKKLPVSIPSHCDLMKPAAEKLSNDLDNIFIQKPKIAVVNNVDVAVYEDPSDIKDALVRQLFSPVRWIETVQYMVDQGINIVVECGPGKVLTGLNKRINQNLELYSLNSFDNLQVMINL